ncbi:MAG: hypothetical protein Ct9H300mP8_06860 [Gammaproteobacteria bacterium]|nr:MAG: hypothetical protein Ct9H300mP8_06860 [Gammaproteobacteria bacterium]
MPRVGEGYATELAIAVNGLCFREAEDLCPVRLRALMCGVSVFACGRSGRVVVTDGGNASCGHRQARKRFENVGDLRRERSAARGEVAMLFHAQFLLDAAEIEYTRAIEEVSLAQWHYLRGIVRMDQGRVLDAIGDFSEVVRQEPKDHLALYRLGTALAVTGNHQGAKGRVAGAELQAPRVRRVSRACRHLDCSKKIGCSPRSISNDRGPLSRRARLRTNLGLYGGG